MKEKIKICGIDFEIKTLYKKFVILPLLILLLAVPALAFSDNFDDGTFNAWDAPADPGMTITTPSYDGSNYTYSSLGSNGLDKTLNVTEYTHWEIVFLMTTAVDTGKYSFRDDNAGNRCVLSMASTTVQSFGYGSCGSLGNILLSVSSGIWYKVTIDDLGSTLNFKIFNVTSGNSTLVSQSIIADVAPFIATRIRVEAPGAGVSALFHFDNVVAQSYTPGSTPSIVSWQNSITLDESLIVYIP